LRERDRGFTEGKKKEKKCDGWKREGKVDETAWADAN
jgi:hypothetical protein